MATRPKTETASNDSSLQWTPDADLQRWIYDYAGDDVYDPMLRLTVSIGPGILVPRLREERLSPDELVDWAYAQDDERRPGKRRKRRDPARYLLATYRHDIGQEQYADLAADFPCDISTVKQWVAEGRQALFRQGAWPWALPLDGRLPQGKWWLGDSYKRLLREWIGMTCFPDAYRLAPALMPLAEGI